MDTYFDHVTSQAINSGLLKGMVQNQDTTDWIRNIAIDVMPEASALNKLSSSMMESHEVDAFNRILGVLCYPNPLLIESVLKSRGTDVSRQAIEFAKLWLTIDYRLATWVKPVANILQRYCNLKTVEEPELSRVKNFLSNCKYKISPLVFADASEGNIELIFPVLTGFPEEVVAWQHTSARIIATMIDELNRATGVECSVKTLEIDIPQLQSLASSIISGTTMKVDSILSRVITVIVVNDLDVDVEASKKTAASLTPPELSLISSHLIEKKPTTASDSITLAMADKFETIQIDWLELKDEFKHRFARSLKKIRNNAPTTSAELRIFADKCHSPEIYDGLYDRQAIMAKYVEYFHVEKHLIPEVLGLATRDLLLHLDSKMSSEGLTFTPTYFEQSFESEPTAQGVH